jgi:hypothetical protein
MKRAVALASALAVLALAGVTTAAAAPTTAYGPFTYAMGDNTDFWTCSGFRLTAGNAVQDHFTCTVEDQTFSGTFTESNPWPCGCTVWWSDYDGRQATSYVIRVSSNGNVTGTARY